MIFGKSFAFLQTELGVKKVLHEERIERKKYGIRKLWRRLRIKNY